MGKKIIAAMLSMALCIQPFTPFCFAGTANTDDKSGTQAMSYVPPRPGVYYVGNDVDPSIYINQSDTNSYSFSFNGSSDPLAQSAGMSKIVQLETSPQYDSGKTEKVLVVPINFTDSEIALNHDKAFYEEQLEDLEDYYELNSGYVAGEKGFTVDAEIYYPSSGVVSSGNNKAFYGGAANDADAYKLAQKVYDIVSADPSIDLNSFDTDENGQIDHVVIIHAGYGQEDAKGSYNEIWSHSSALMDEYPFKDAPLQLYNYIMIPEVCDLGTLAHEFGHDIGLPDLYDSDDTTNGYSSGAGYWDIMAYGCYNSASGNNDGSSPANLSAWCRYYMGWLTPTELSSEGTISLTNTNGMSSAYLIRPDGNAAAGEYYLVEYRRKIGYDVGLPAEGVLVWHVDDARIRTIADPQNNTIFDYNLINSNSSRLGVALEQADGLYELENGKDAINTTVSDAGDVGDPFPGSTFKTYFSALPNGMNYSNITNASFTYVDIENIETLGKKATMDVFYKEEAPESAPVALAPYNAGISESSTTFVWTPVAKAKDYYLEIRNSDKSYSNTINLTSTSRTAGLLTRIGDNLAYTVDPEIGGTLSFNSGDTVYWRIGAANETGVVWSELNSYTRYESVSPTTPNIPSKTAATGTSVSIAWDEVSGATGYSVLADGKEIYCSSNSCTVTGLDQNTPHYFKVRAVLSGSISGWSDQLIAYTATPSITVDASSVIEGNESAGYLDITLTDGTFLSYGDYSSDTVSLLLGNDLTGVTQGEIAYVNSSTIRISLHGNCTSDYETVDDLSVEVTIAKELLSCNRFPDITGTTHIEATDENIIPAVSFCFDGANAKKLFGATTAMVYSLNGGTTYTAAAANKLLTTAELNSITSDNDIRIKYRNSTDTEEQTIDILQGPTTAPAVTADDTANTISNLTTDMDFSTDNATWTRYNGSNLPALTGTLTLLVRVGGVGMTLPGSAAATLKFTAPASEGSGGGGGGGGGSTETTNNGSSVERSGLIMETDTISSQLNNSGAANVIASIPGNAEEQSAALPISAYREMVAADKGLIVNGELVKIALPADAISSSLLTNTEAFLKVSMDELTETKSNGILPETPTVSTSGLFAVGTRVFELTAAIIGSSGTQYITSFTHPVTITIKLDGADLAGMNTEKLGAYYYNETTKVWEYMGGTYAEATGTLTFTTKHFSLYSVMEYDKTFSDIQKHWAKNDIELMASKYIAKGTGETFNPNKTITRAEFTAMLIRALGVETNASSAVSFSDVGSAKWYYGEISTAYSAGILSEKGNVPFRPDSPITREEMSVMVINSLKLSDAASLTEAETTAILSDFKDASEVSADARQKMAEAIKKGIIKGRDGETLAPAATSTRAEAVVIIKRVLDTI